MLRSLLSRDIGLVLDGELAVPGADRRSTSRRSGAAI
jgi:hypothetical protein